MKKNGLILLSGGFDSIALLYNRRREIKEALFINYGAKNSFAESLYATKHCDKLKIPLKVISIAETFWSLGSDSSMFLDKKSSPVIPFRNGILLSVAISYADINKYDVVFYGALGSISESISFPDCSYDFMNAINRCAIEGTENSVRVSAPYIEWTKGELAAFTQFNGNLEHAMDSYSCYEGREKHCGVCFACKQRKLALKDVDTTEYEK